MISMQLSQKDVINVIGFFFEGYNLFYRELGRDSIEMIKCKRCIDNNKKI